MGRTRRAGPPPTGLAALACACACLLAAGARAGREEAYAPPPFGHYQPILDRMPFGSPPPPAADTSAADPEALRSAEQEQAEQQALAKQVTLSAVNVTPKGATAVGFTDRSANPPANYYLRVGESADGWTVKNADFTDELATLEKDGVEITLKLGEGLLAAPPAAAAPPLASAPTPAPPGVPSFADRLRERVVQKSQAEREAEARLHEQFENLARETAAREIQRRQEEEAQAAEEKALLEQQQQQHLQEQ